MKPVRFVALGDSLTEGVGDPVGDGWRGWAALLAGGLGPSGAVEFHNLAVSGARTLDVVQEQTPRALALRPDLASVIIGVNDTLRRSYDIQAVAAGLSRVYAAFAAQGVALVTACLPDPGAMLRLPGLLARPLARRQQSVNAVVHALSERYGALHLHLAEGEWLTDRAMWSADRLHPGERGHRILAAHVHRLLADAGIAAGPPPPAEPELPPPSWWAKVRWLATKGTAWVLRRSTDLLPQLLALAGQEVRHWARGTSARLDAHASRTAAAALAAVSAGQQPIPLDTGSARPVVLGTGPARPAQSGPGPVPFRPSGSGRVPHVPCGPVDVPCAPVDVPQMSYGCGAVPAQSCGGGLVPVPPPGAELVPLPSSAAASLTEAPAASATVS
jgi:lysophospholipase L1-like esterase